MSSSATRVEKGLYGATLEHSWVRTLGEYDKLPVWSWRQRRRLLGVLLSSSRAVLDLEQFSAFPVEYFDRPDLSKSCFYDFHVEYSIEADIGGRLQSAERHWLGWTKQTQRAVTEQRRLPLLMCLPLLKYSWEYPALYSRVLWVFVVPGLNEYQQESWIRGLVL